MCIFIHLDGWHVAAVASWVPTKQLCFLYNRRKQLVATQVLSLVFMHDTAIIMESSAKGLTIYFFSFYTKNTCFCNLNYGDLCLIDMIHLYWINFLILKFIFRQIVHRIQFFHYMSLYCCQRENCGILRNICKYLPIKFFIYFSPSCTS